MFAGDAVALLLASGLNPFGAFPYWLSFFAAAQPLGAYSSTATSDYKPLADDLLKAWGAATAGGLFLSVPGDLIGGKELGIVYVLGCLAKALVVFACLGGVRGFQVYEKTGKLPTLDMDDALNPGADPRFNEPPSPPPAQ